MTTEFNKKIKIMGTLIRQTESERDSIARKVKECLDKIESLKAKLTTAQEDYQKQEELVSQMSDATIQITLINYRQSQKTKMTEMRQKIDIAFIEYQTLQDELFDVLSTLKTYEHLETGLLEQQRKKNAKDEMLFLDELATQGWYRQQEKN